MHNEHFIAFDTETGGFDSTECALLSIAAVPSWDAPPFSIHILPVGRIEPKAAEVNGYSHEEWQRRGAVTPKVAAIEYQHWRYHLDSRRYDLAAHNAGFDALFLLALQARTGVDLFLPGIWHCTKIKLQALRDDGILPAGDNHLNDLGALSGFWDIAPRSTHHDALQDAQCVKHGLFWLREKRKEAPHHA
jgi:DNA polymerase III epsilon subunit-like protein